MQELNATVKLYARVFLFFLPKPLLNEQSERNKTEMGVQGVL